MPYPNVLSPIRIGKHLLKNRIISAPSTLHSATDGELYPTEEAMAFFENRAKAGAAMVTVAGASVLPAGDDGMHAAWDLYKPNSTNKLAQLAERIHFHGAKASMELIGIFPGEYAVSDGAPLMSNLPGKEIPVSEMTRFKEGYGNAAAILKDLGFDAVLLHFGHAIPIAGFLSPLTNKRTDEYGGSTENRVRYIKEILAEIRAKVGSDMLIEARISGSEFEEGGIDLDEGMRIGEMLQDQIDILQVSAGMHTPNWNTVTHPCGFVPPMPNVFLAEAFRKSGRFHVPITTIGGIGTLADVEDIIAAGKADFVAIARAFIADIDLIRKGRESRNEDVTPCIKCMRCHDSTVYGRLFRCSVNPVAGLEHSIAEMVSPPKRVKKVAVVGGGPAGMKAALTAAGRGHDVTLYEMTDSLGGAIRFAEHVPFKYPLAGYKNFLVRQVEKSPVKVKLGTCATADMLRAGNYDAVVAAIGAEPVKPPIPGVERVLLAVDIYGQEDTLGDKVIIIGGGQVGCETALHLARLGKETVVVELRDALAPDASPSHRDELMIEIGRQDNLTYITSARCTALSPKSVAYAHNGEEITLEAESVVLAAGMQARTAEADAFIGAAEEYIPAGDCVQARTVELATKEGYYAGIGL